MTNWTVCSVFWYHSDYNAAVVRLIKLWQKFSVVASNSLEYFFNKVSELVEVSIADSIVKTMQPVAFIWWKVKKARCEWNSQARSRQNALDHVCTLAITGSVSALPTQTHTLHTLVRSTYRQVSLRAIPRIFSLVIRAITQARRKHRQQSPTVPTKSAKFRFH